MKLTKEYILNLKQGKELDSLICEHVFNEKKPEETHSDSHIDPIVSKKGRGFWACVPDYEKGDNCEWIPDCFSLDRGLAFLVLDKICSENPNYNWYIEKSSKYSEFYLRLEDDSQGTWDREGTYNLRIASLDGSDELATMICKIALLSKFSRE